MTPQLQQAIKLLQLSNVELNAFLEEELERNPMLERDDSTPDQGQEPERGRAVDQNMDEGNPPDRESVLADSEQASPVSDSLEQAESQNLPSQAEAPLDTDYENFYTNDGAAETGGAALGPESNPFEYRGTGGGLDGGEEGSSLEQRLSERPSLRQHLVDQWQIEATSPADRIIGMHLIDMLDESGYLLEDFSGLFELLGCEAENVEATLARMQGLDPPGIFARSLRECLALQLADLNRLDPAMELLLDNLDLLAKGDLQKLRKICAVDAEDLADMIAEIKALDPKPALSFDPEVAEPVIPDILMRPQPAGGWLLELNSETLPRVLVNNHYYATVSAKTRSKDEKEYVSECFQSANWLVRSLHQRATTILKVSSEIIRQQDGFFRHGVQHLKPLTLKDIAEVIEMHESTVSRVTTNKYLATPRGTYELKYFFTSSVSGTDGLAHSAESVRHRIKVLIEAESPKKILSDDSLVDMLRQDGVEIARRTVAKYRESLRIPSSVQRRREKAALR